MAAVPPQNVGDYQSIRRHIPDELNVQYLREKIESRREYVCVCVCVFAVSFLRILFENRKEEVREGCIKSTRRYAGVGM